LGEGKEKGEEERRKEEILKAKRKEGKIGLRI
jgi:hypothetical protein